MSGLRSGFTTGTCAAFAAKAATSVIFFGNVPKDLSVITPKGIKYRPEYTIHRSGNDNSDTAKLHVSAEVKKDAGDDPDVTDGMTIRAIVHVPKYSSDDNDTPVILIDGGKGVGRVTKPGLDQPVGNAAINHVPRQMITENVMEVCRKADFHGVINVVIEADGGEEIAEKTFNPRLGIVGGISILGTTGIVEPMSDEAIVDTIRVEIHQKKALGYDILPLAFGNYGQEFLLRDYGFDLDTAVKSSNFIKDALTIAQEEGFRKILLVGHLGKIVKVAGGFSNTHSRYGDCRMEILTTAMLRSGAPITIEEARTLAASNTTETATDYLVSIGRLHQTMEVIVSEILSTINHWTPELHVELMIYTINQGLIANTSEAFSYMSALTE